jgi:hypothetical protein
MSKTSNNLLPVKFAAFNSAVSGASFVSGYVATKLLADQSLDPKDIARKTGIAAGVGAISGLIIGTALWFATRHDEVKDAKKAKADADFQAGIEPTAAASTEQ